MKIDVVIPTYNSEASISHLLNRLNEWVQTTKFVAHFIFVDDCSKDKTLQVLREGLETINFSYQVVELLKNHGQHTAVAIGLGFCTSNYIVTMDDDLQHDPFEIEHLFEKLISDKYDLVYANFEDKKHHQLRNFGTKALQQILKWTDRDYSMVTSFRIMRNEVAKQFIGRNRKVYFIEEYLLNVASKVGVCNISHRKRLIGSSNYSGYRLVKMALLILLLHSSFPLKFISRIGVLFSLVFFGIGIYFIRQKLLFDVELGYTSIIVSIFFTTGLLLFSIGIIGEYIRKIWLLQQGMDEVQFRNEN